MLWQWTNDVKFEKELTCQFKTDMKNLTNFDPSTWKCQKFTLCWASFDQTIECLSLESTGSYVWRHSKLIQNLNENWLVFQKWYEKFDKFSPKHLKVSKLGLWWNRFVQSWKCRSLKFTGELFVSTMNYYPKIEEGLTCQFKTDICSLTNFAPSTQMSQKVALKFAACDQSI